MTATAKPAKAKKPKLEIPQQAMGISAFCRANDISRGLFYLMLADGTAPETFQARGRRLISTEAAGAWREQLIQATKTRAAAQGGASC